MPEILIKYADEKIIGVQLVEKVCFFKKSACSQSLSQTPFPGKGLYTGATAPRPCGGYAPATRFYIIKRFIDSLYADEMIVGVFVCGGLGLIGRQTYF